jgi:hypothetical protein
MREQLCNDFARLRPEGRGQARFPTVKGAEATFFVESFRSSSRFVVDAEAPTEIGQGVRKFASHRCHFGYESQRDVVCVWALAVAQSWYKTRNQKVDSTSLEVLRPFGVFQLGKS